MVINLKWLLLLILTSMLVTLSVDATETDTCFYEMNKGSSSCNHYSYDRLAVYFRDALNVEQKVIVKRVRSRANGELVHADYDFEVNCNGTCGATDQMVRSVMWAFRNAIVENRLYIKEVIEEQPCDPSMESCCDETGCNQFFDAAEENNTAGYSTQSPGKGILRTVERGIHLTDAVTSIHRNVAGDSRNEFDYPQMCVAQKVFVEMPIFSFIEISTGNYKLCQLDRVGDGGCNIVDGRFVESEYSGFAEFRHDNGHAFNRQIRDFMERFFIENRGMYCSQSMSCDAIGNCEIKMTCRKP